MRLIVEYENLNLSTFKIFVCVYFSYDRGDTCIPKQIWFILIIQRKVKDKRGKKKKKKKEIWGSYAIWKDSMGQNTNSQKLILFHLSSLHIHLNKFPSSHLKATKMLFLNLHLLVLHFDPTTLFLFFSTFIPFLSSIISS